MSVSCLLVIDIFTILTEAIGNVRQLLSNALELKTVSFACPFNWHGFLKLLFAAIGTEKLEV
jgi:hypothetical protein